MPHPILTLTTDFGVRDHYVGVMKGVILGICPQAQIVDISHEVEPYAIAEGAYTIAQAYRHFPRNTTHVVVVDPGVGSERRPVLVEAAGQVFIAPDNGVLSMVCSQEAHEARLISNQELFRKPVSHTFHGRDIFAPVAAHIAAGVAPEKVGEPIGDLVSAEFANPRQVAEGHWSGRILKIDRFGNVITNLRAADFPDLETRSFTLTIGSARVHVLASNYAERGGGELFVIGGSSGFLEVSINQDSAARAAGCHMGSDVAMVLE